MKEANQQDITSASQQIAWLILETKKVLIGQDRLMRNLVIALLARGHIILEWVPGLAKTLAIETLGKALGIQTARVQFTPDLLPSDLVGSQIWNQAKGEFVTVKGPIFTHLLLADEINRSPAKVQSALLEAMAERQVTIADESFALEAPFVVMATQNPVEQDGTYDLPEAQLDRFLLKTSLSYPSEDEEIQIMKRFTEASQTQDIQEVIPHTQIIWLQWLADQIHVSDTIYEYIRNIVVATRNHNSGYIQFGASPRASLALVQSTKAFALMQGRTFVIPEDVQELAEDVLQHRLVLSFDALANNIDSKQLIWDILTSIPVHSA